MDEFLNRLDSFKAKRVKGGKGQKKWPHGRSFTATPESLAEAGFYFAPEADTPDCVTCFMCGKTLQEWDEEDDPHEIHYNKCRDRCAWALLRCGINRDVDVNGRLIFMDKTRLPTSKVMEKARLETFTSGTAWKHDETKGHGASSKMMARAGFVHTPQAPDLDLATCLYCQVSLSGWAEDDDPVEEHRKRVMKQGSICPFFLPKSSRATKLDIVAAVKDYDGSGTESEAHVQSGSGSTAKTPRKASVPKKGAKTPARSRVPSKAASAATETEDDEDDTLMSAPAPPATKRRATHSRSRSTAVIEDPPAPLTVKKAKAKGKQKAVAERGDEEEGHDVQATPKAPSRPPSRSHRKTASTVEPKPVAKHTSRARPNHPTSRTRQVNDSDATSATENDDDDELVLPPPTAKKTTRRTTTRKTRGASPAPSQTDAESQASPPPRKVSRAKTKAKAQEIVEDEVESEIEHHLPPPTVKKVKAKAKPAPQMDEETSDVDTPVKKTKTQVKPDSHEDIFEVEMPVTAKLSKANTKSKASVPVASADEQDPPATAAPRGRKVSTRTASAAVPAKQRQVSRSKPLERDSMIFMSDSLGMAQSSKSELNPAFTFPAQTKPALNRAGSMVGSTNHDARTKTVVDISDDEEGAEESNDKPVPKAKVAVKVATRAKPTVTDIDQPVTKGKVASKADPVLSDDGKEEDIPVSRHIAKAKVVAKVPSKAKALYDDDEAKDKSLSRPISHAKVAAKAPSNAKALSDDGEEEEVPVSRPISRAKAASKAPSTTSRETPTTDARMTPSSQESAPSKPKPTSSHSSTGRSEGFSVGAITTPSSQQLSDGPTDIADDLMMDVDSGSGSGDMTDVAEALQVVEPVTPPRRTTPAVAAPSLPRETRATTPNANLAGADDTSSFPFIPPLSKMPFVNIERLSEAEFAMTVEEWIHHQIEQEYERFRLDGQREIEAFQQRAEEVKAAIRGLPVM